MSQYFAAIEAGGTKFNCAIIGHDRVIHAQTRIPTTTPDETLSRAVEFFNQHRSSFDFSALGLASFGPLDLNPASATYGNITKTPKPHWSDSPITAYLAEALQVDVQVDTDVNAAALAEYRWGAAQRAEVCIYVTVGTGVGGGVVVHGKPVHGLVHPELGHMLVEVPDDVKGVCPFHGNCVEGVASGAAMAKIWQQPAETLTRDHRAWQVETDVLAQFCHNLMISFSPNKIIFGGGVMAQQHLLDTLVSKTEQRLADYIAFPGGISLSDIICHPGLGTHSGLFGALALVLQDS